ncbi:canopy family protein seele isoform X2 [Arctopsyche grandis]
MVEIGNYRLDETGNIHQNKVPLSRSQVHLSDMVDDVCSKMTDYVRVRYKATQKLAVMKMMSDTGGMNPDFSYTDFVTDDDLNKSLEFYCEEIVGENEDQLVEIYAKRPTDELPDGKIKFCDEYLNLCEDWMLPSEEDRNWSPDDEKSRGANPYGFGGMNMPPNNDYEDDEELEEDVGELELKANDKEEL